AQREGIAEFVFAPAATAATPPSYRHSPGAGSWPSLAEARNAPRRSTAGNIGFIEEPTRAPAALPGEFWVSAPWKDGKPGSPHDERDPAAQLRVVVDARGQVLAARVVDAATADMGARALDAMFDEGVSFATAQSAVFDVPARFFAAPVEDFRHAKPPAYPIEAGRRGLEGSVKMVMTVDASGKPSDIEVIEAAQPVFVKPVVDAFLKLRFTPATRLGKPVAFRTTMKYSFRQEGGSPPGAKARPAPPETPEPFRYDTPPVALLMPPPVHPYELARAGTGGSATVDFVVAPDGTVWTVLPLDASDPAFGQALKAAVESWTFRPAVKDGKPAWAIFRYTHSFRMAGLSGPRRILRELDEPQPAIATARDLDAKPVQRVSAMPTYPREQMDAGTSGNVVLEFFVDREGNVQWPHVVSTPDEALGWAAVQAASRWRFDPPQQKGKAVDVRLRTAVRFEPRAVAP
ncbi:MAG: TonB family protein, partial [Solimonas sp.]